MRLFSLISRPRFEYALTKSGREPGAPVKGDDIGSADFAFDAPQSPRNHPEHQSQPRRRLW